MKHWWMAGLVVWLAVPVVAGPPVGEDDFFAPERLAAMARDIQPLIEAETGHKFTSPPPIKVCTKDEMADMLTQELIPQIRLQSVLPMGAEKEAHEAAVAITPHILGKYSLRGHTVWIVPYNYDAMMDVFLLQGDIDPHLLMRVVTTHEMVHAQDEQLYGAVSHVSKLKTGEALKVWNALLEGHAQSVTRRVFVRLHQQKLFEAFVERTLPSPPPGASKAQLAVYKNSFAFAYVAGMKFFDAIHKPGKFDDGGHVFAHPPTSVDQIEHPEKYHP